MEKNYIQNHDNIRPTPSWYYYFLSCISSNHRHFLLSVGQLITILVLYGSPFFSIGDTDLGLNVCLILHKVLNPIIWYFFYFNEAVTTHCDPASQFKVEEQQYHDFFFFTCSVSQKMPFHLLSLASSSCHFLLLSSPLAEVF